MKIDFETPGPQAGRPRPLQYQPIIDALNANPGAWLAVPLTDLSGDTPKRKQNGVYTGLLFQGIRVTTRTQNGKLYLRLKEPTGQVVEVAK